MCCLVETYPHRHATRDDFLRTLKFAYLYAKTVTLGNTHWPETNRVMLRNRRIGCSMSGIAQFVAARGIEAFREWCTMGYDTIQKYDTIYSEWLITRPSIKTTSIKPSGTVSLLAGATPGMHWPIARFYKRRVRVPRSSAFVECIRRSGRQVEPAVGDEENTMVVEFLVDSGVSVRKESEVSMWEQLNMAAFLQRYWSDNQVSCTIKFDPEREGPQIQHALDFFQYQLKGISFLPNTRYVFPQLPYEEITEQEYLDGAATSVPIDYSTVLRGNTEPEAERFCDGDSCVM